VPTTGVFEIRLNRNAAAERPLQFDGMDKLPAIPALPETLLLMELKIRDFSVDLGEFSKLVLGDVGATLQIFRTAAREYGEGGERPRRIEDCISALGLEACLRAAAAGVSSRSSCGGTMLELWAHSREVAQNCGALAEEKGGALSPEDAYQIGLMHGIGNLPRVLGWTVQELAAEEKSRAVAWLARQWSLPAGVQDYFAEKQYPAKPSHWDELLQLAHQRARRSPVCASLGCSTVLQLRRRV
jgi:HDOD domain